MQKIFLFDDCNFSWYVMVNVVQRCNLEGSWEEIEVVNDFFFFEFNLHDDCRVINESNLVLEKEIKEDDFVINEGLDDKFIHMDSS